MLKKDRNIIEIMLDNKILIKDFCKEINNIKTGNYLDYYTLKETIKHNNLKDDLSFIELHKFTRYIYVEMKIIDNETIKILRYKDKHICQTNREELQDLYYKKIDEFEKKLIDIIINL